MASDKKAIGSKRDRSIRHSSQRPIRIPALPPGTVKTTAQPYLLLSYTYYYTWIYDDSGSGATMDVCIWRPNPPDGYFIIGDYAQGNYGEPTDPATIVTAVNDPNNTLLQPPLWYEQVWNDRHSGGDFDGSIWAPSAPDNYVSIGCVGQLGYDSPSIPGYRCINRSLVENGQLGNLIWNDRHSGATLDVELFADLDIVGIFLAQGNYNPYTGPCFAFQTS